MPNYDIALKEFDERFIGNISKKYYDYLNQVMFKDVDAKHYFKNTGDYGIIHKSRLDSYTREDLNKFNNILFPCNIDILAYVLENKDIFKDLNFLDIGCGFGILSAFLRKTDILCYNYDNLLQLAAIPDFDSYIKDLIDIPKVTNEVQEEWFDKVNVLTMSSSFVTERKFLDFKNLKYMLLDKLRVDDELAPELIAKYNFRIIKELPETIVYGK